MTQPDTQDPSAVIAALAVGLTNGSPRGPVPDLDEIERFRLGELSEPRRGEVLSHLAHDPACFQLLHALESAEAHLGAVKQRLSNESDHAAAKGRRVRSWRLLPRRRRPRRVVAWGGGLAGALAAALVLVAVLPLLPVYQVEYGIDAGYRQLDGADPLWPTDWPSLGRPRSKSFGFNLPPATTRVDPRQRRSFKAGVRAGLTSLVSPDPRWTRVIDALPRSTPDCPMLDRECRARMATAAAVGRWAIMIFAQCRADQESATSAFWIEQDRVHRQLVDLARQSLAPFVVDLDLLAGEGDPHERLCRGIDDVLRDGLGDEW